MNDANTNQAIPQPIPPRCGANVNPSWRRLATWLLATWLLAGTSRLSADEVIVKDARGNLLRRAGQVSDYKGGSLTLQMGTRELVIAHETIHHVEAEWLPEQRSADEAYQQFQYDQALEQYRAAFRGESRPWVQRSILARVVRCQRNLGRITEACQIFGRLVADDPHTHYVDAIPLTWEDAAVAQGIEPLLSPWLRNDGSSAEQLVAASWLLNSQHRAAAVSTLRELGRDPWEPVAKLAVAQLWRVELPQLQAARRTWWEEFVASMPIDLRAGSYFLLGRSYDQLGDAESAALAYLRVPTQYPHDRSLAQAAYFHCGETLRQAGRRDEALHCYLQLGTSGGRYADHAQERIKELQK